MSDDRISILLIEDNPGDAEFYTDGLLRGAPEGSTVVGAASLEEALARLAAGTFDLVVSDLRLPDSCGEETLAALGKVCRPGSIVVVTGMEDEEMGLRALREGAADFLLKSELSGRALRRSLRHALERLRRHRLEEAFYRTEKLEAVRRLASGIAHHFNNLLTIIIGNTALIEAAHADHPGTVRHAREVQAASDRAAFLVRHLLQFCGSGELSIESLDVNAVLRSIEPMLRQVLGEPVELVMRLSDDIGMAAADRMVLEQSVLILALNGRDAMKRGGRLTVTTRLSARPPAAPVFVVVTVIDEGDGVDAAAAAHLCEPFFTTKEVGQGNGLGLAAVHGVVAQAGGHLDLVSMPGHGTSLSIFLPAQRN